MVVAILLHQIVYIYKLDSCIPKRYFLWEVHCALILFRVSEPSPHQESELGSILLSRPRVAHLLLRFSCIKSLVEEDCFIVYDL